ncbi:hypothetical protein DFP72DRAFT_807868 [Ephemerocybe angulata]|uniref:HMG domain-containing protein n=1 Tax=Ephemerocybe angulata TaxID=980116 RepID=A0A8H6MA02_9AGAR|nr:hypothetical protein DFP72DRAFT_807868 [Tulosesus angulatus]
MTRRNKRSRREESDDEESHSFPAELLTTVDDSLWSSPTKAQRSVRPQKRVPKVVFGRTSGEKGGIKAGAEVTYEPQEAVEGQEGFGGPIEDDSPPLPGLEDLDPVDADFEDYGDAVASHVAGYYHLQSSLFVVQGWDSTRSRTTDAWYHLRYQSSSEDEMDTGCSCPKGLNKELCVHRRYFKEYEVDSLLPEGLEGEDGQAAAAVLFLRRVVGSHRIQSLFSTKSMSSSELKGRAIVSNEVSRKGSVWRCSKDPGLVSCFHISKAQEAYPEVSGDLTELDDLVDSSSFSLSVGDLARGPGTTVSYLPVHPPLWCRLPSDPILYPDPPPVRFPPGGVFRLERDSTCSCASGRTAFDPDGVIKVRTSKLYTILGLYMVEIQTQPCPVCPSPRKKAIGPDLRSYGVFNFNNSVLVSHELLDEYTSSFTSSETPFTAWYTQLSRRYTLTGSQFMGDDLFRAVWFAYISLQRFEDDMTCSACGPSPDTVIWDGITLAFGRKHLRGTLRPPTTTVPESVVRPNVVSRPRQQLIIDRTLRKNIRLTTQPPSKDALVDDPGGKFTETQLRRHALVVKEPLERVESVGSELGAKCEALGRVYLANYGKVPFASGKVPVPAVKSLLIQIAAEESVLQLVNYAALVKLREFLVKPIADAAFNLMPIPAFYKAVTQNAAPLDDLVAIMRWVEENARRVFTELIVEGTLPDADPASISTDMRDVQAEISVSQTGCCYSMPIVRHRPIYSRLAWEMKKKEPSGQRGDRCGKYYTQYGERRLTGGIMVCWCSHSICYGFHCIPQSEGRDDVFSAMVTRWKVAPKRVVYDFACALGPYCLLREPMFFANTFFAIDIFHASGHTKCSPAAFLSEYMNVDTRLEYINSSAAECGNGALRRIRKSVSYMGQERAIIYTKVFLSVWNRMKMLRLD